MHDMDISMDSEGLICNIYITYEYNSVMANFRDYDILTRIITIFSIKPNVIVYVIQLSHRVYNVTFPAYDLYSLRLNCSGVCDGINCCKSVIITK